MTQKAAIWEGHRSNFEWMPAGICPEISEPSLSFLQKLFRKRRFGEISETPRFFRTLTLWRFYEIRSISKFPAEPIGIRTKIRWVATVIGFVIAFSRMRNEGAGICDKRKGSLSAGKREFEVIVSREWSDKQTVKRWDRLHHRLRISKTDVAKIDCVGIREMIFGEYKVLYVNPNNSVRSVLGFGMYSAVWPTGFALTTFEAILKSQGQSTK